MVLRMSAPARAARELGSGRIRKRGEPDGHDRNVAPKQACGLGQTDGCLRSTAQANAGGQ